MLRLQIGEIKRSWRYSRVAFFWLMCLLMYVHDWMYSAQQSAAFKISSEPSAATPRVKYIEDYEGPVHIESQTRGC